MADGTLDVPFQGKKLDSKTAEIGGQNVERQAVAIGDSRNVPFYASFTPIRELLQQQPIRLVGQTFTGTTLDTNEWVTSGIVGTGAVTLTGDSATTISTGATANSAVVLSTTRQARFMFGHANMFRMVLKTPDAGTINNTRRFGVGNTTDGLGFIISGTSFGIFYQNNGVTTDVTSGLNGELGTTFAWGTNAKALEIVYFTAGYWFFVDGKLLHSLPLSSLSAPLTQTLSLPIRISNINSGGSTTNVSMSVWNVCVFRLGNSLQRPKYANITTNATTVLKRGAGTLRRVVINTNGAISNTAAIRDGVDATGALIATINTTASVGGVFEYDLDFFTGLTVVTATGTAANITVVYD